MGLRAITLVALLAMNAGCAQRRPQSAWVHPGRDGKLVYRTTQRGDRIMDFSHAGYMGGGVALPHVPRRVTVHPTGSDDDTGMIQAVIDDFSKATPGADGFRGAIELAPGSFTCAGAIVIGTSGIVLRGSGSGDGGTTIKMTGPRHRAMTIGREGGAQASAANEPREAAPATREAATSITNAYVPAGTNAFTVADAAGFA